MASEFLSKSLLDCILEKVEGQQQKTSFVSRTLWIGRLKDGGSSSAALNLTRDVLSVVRRRQERAAFMTAEDLEASVTGIQLGLSTFVATLVEASPSVLESMYETIMVHHLYHSTFDDIRVIAYTDDIPKRSFHTFVNKDVAPPNADVQLDDENLVANLADLYLNFVQLGDAMAGKRDSQLASFLETMKTTCAHLFPSAELLKQIFIVENVISIDEFLDAFVRPLDVTLDNEVVWPAPVPVAF
eukprot:ANDGO_06783.mRNA.1 hypothetical protein LPMP_241270